MHKQSMTLKSIHYQNFLSLLFSLSPSITTKSPQNLQYTKGEGQNKTMPSFNILKRGKKIKIHVCTQHSYSTI